MNIEFVESWTDQPSFLKDAILDITFFHVSIICIMYRHKECMVIGLFNFGIWINF
jgi:hypothetical protein